MQNMNSYWSKAVEYKFQSNGSEFNISYYYYLILFLEACGTLDLSLQLVAFYEILKVSRAYFASPEKIPYIREEAEQIHLFRYSILSILFNINASSLFARKNKSFIEFKVLFSFVYEEFHILEQFTLYSMFQK